MEILGNMQILSSCSRVLTSLRYQDQYFGCGESQRYHYERCAMLKLPFVATKFRPRRVKKRGKKEQKMKNCILEKKSFLFLHVHELDIILRVNTDRKNRVGKVCSPKKFFVFLSPVKVRNFGNFLICVCTKLDSCFHSNSDKNQNIFSNS